MKYTHSYYAVQTESCVDLLPLLSNLPDLVRHFGYCKLFLTEISWKMWYIFIFIHHIQVAKKKDKQTSEQLKTT